MTKVMLTFDEDYADEFNMYGWCIVDEALYHKVKELVEAFESDSEQEWYFGTNQCFHFTAKEMLDAHEPRLLSEMEATSISRVMGGNEHGYTGFDMLLDHVLCDMPEKECHEFNKKWL